MASLFGLALSSEAKADSIIIPKIDLRAPVGNILDNGPMWVWNARPNENRTVWIAGHRTTHSRPFYNLDKLNNGDKIFVKVNGNAYRYTVIRKTVIPSSYNYKSRLGDRLLLTACARSDGSPTSAKFRIAVFAKPDINE